MLSLGSHKAAGFVPGPVSDAWSSMAKCSHDTVVLWCDGQKDYLACTLLSCCEVLDLLSWPLSAVPVVGSWTAKVHF